MPIRRFASIALALTVPASLTAAAGEPAPPFADIPHVTVVDYDVSGRSSSAIRRAIDAVRPTDANDGKRVDGLSRSQFRWRWTNDGRGKCTSSSEDISFSATVTVPRLVQPKASDTLREQFDRFRRSLLQHEEGHVRYAWDHRGDIIAAINSATCATAKVAADQALQAIAAHDIAYDKATRHGAATIVPFN